MTGPAGPGPRVLLMGMMGAGKTTVGTALSRRTGWPYLDNDELVHRATGRTTPDVLASGGVAELRRAESLALAEALTAPTPVIAAVAAGVVEDARDLERLRTGGCVVWLRARLETLVSRVGTGAGRPWLQGDAATALAALYEGRAPLYERAAGLIVDVDELPGERVADRILAALPHTDDTREA